MLLFFSYLTNFYFNAKVERAYAIRNLLRSHMANSLSISAFYHICRTLYIISFIIIDVFLDFIDLSFNVKVKGRIPHNLKLVIFQMRNSLSVSAFYHTFPQKFHAIFVKTI